MKVSILSPTKQEFDEVVYYKCGPYYQNRGRRLHRMVWIFHHGLPPAGYHVHHIDGDAANNDVDNLRLLPSFEHLSTHNKPRHEYHMRHIKLMQDLAKKWHVSPEGRSWHGEHAKEAWAKRGLQTYNCAKCGIAFETRHRYGEDQNTFCSNKCKAQYRRDSGADNVTRVCEVCGREFLANKYAKVRFCSEECRKS
jgi:hypothetical protein